MNDKEEIATQSRGQASPWGWKSAKGPFDEAEYDARAEGRSPVAKAQICSLC